MPNVSILIKTNVQIAIKVYLLFNFLQYEIIFKTVFNTIIYIKKVIIKDFASRKITLKLFFFSNIFLTETKK